MSDADWEQAAYMATDRAKAAEKERDALRARVAELEADVRAAVQMADEARAACHGLGCGACVDCLKSRAEKAEAQVAAARAMCLRFNANPESAMPSPVSMVLRAMDEATKK